MDRAIQLSVLFALSVVANAALADGPIRSGSVALSAERLTGFFHASDSGAGNHSVDNFALLGQQSTGPYDLPRVGIDFFVARGLSLGGTLAVDYTTAGGTGSRSHQTLLLIAPRIGYATMFSSRAGFWPRVSFSYMHAWYGTGGGTSLKTHAFFVGAEVPFLLALAQSFAITLGPALDVTLDHSSNYASIVALGLAAGLSGWF